MADKVERVELQQQKRLSFLLLFLNEIEVEVRKEITAEYFKFSFCSNTKKFLLSSLQSRKDCHFVVSEGKNKM